MEHWEHLLDELRTEITQREDELRFLREIDLRMLRSDRPLNTTFSFIVRGTQELLKSDHTHILLRRGSFLQPSYSASGSDLDQRIDISASLTGQCLTSGKLLNIPDLALPEFSSRYVPILGYTGESMRSLLAAPIKVGDTMVGVLNAESTRLNAFKAAHEGSMGAIASQVAMALQRSRLFDQNTLFAEVDKLIFADADSPHVIQSALEKVMNALHELEHIQLTDALIAFRRGEDLEIVHSTDPSVIGLVLGGDESICGRAVREGKTVILADVSEERDYRRLFGPAIQSEIAIPILLGDERVPIGVLNLESEEKDVFQGFSQVILESFAERVRILLAFAKLRSDVTEAIEVRNANDLLVAVGDQASNMIHRLNNTVGAMRIRIIELQEKQQAGKLKLESDESLTKVLDSLRNLAERTLQMPDEVTQRLNQQSRTINVNEAVREARAKLRVPDNVTVDLKLDPELPLLSLYSFDIVLQNLLQNALDAMPDGGTLSVVTSSAVQPELPIGYVHVTIRDTGVGIPGDILPRLFDINFSTKRAKGEGLGLGLWWIRNFVRRVKGDISVVSTVGAGSEFLVRIPVDRPGNGSPSHHE